MKNFLLGSVAFLALSGCMDFEELNQEAFYTGLILMCGQQFEGEVVESIESDKTWRESRIVMHIESCEGNEIRIPLSVGEDTSRTWVITREEGALTLKHDHRHEDGTPDEVTMYGGTTVAPGTPNRQEFPADQYSKDLFIENGLDVSVDNTWVLEIFSGEKFSYRLQRPGRTFQIDFDLTKPVE